MRVGLFACILCSSPLLAQLNKDLGSPNQYRGVNATDAQVERALKEALSIASSNAIRTTSAENGFWNNSSIKITMPEYMRNLEQGLRMAGQGLRINDFELSMNRAAEMASPAAESLFSKAIAGLKFTDARLVLNGGRSATTDYLATNASADLVKALHLAVESAMNKTGVNTNYDALVIQMKGLTLGQVPPFDIANYLVRRTLDGLFFMSGAEEDKIRNDPQAQVTPGVKEVFAKH